MEVTELTGYVWRVIWIGRSNKRENQKEKNQHKSQNAKAASALKHPRCGSRSHNYSSCAIAVYGSKVPGVMELGVRIIYYTYLV